MLRLMIINRAGAARARGEDEDRVSLVFGEAYAPGDRIVLEADSAPCRLIVQLEDSLPPACLYLAQTRHEFVVPFGEKRAGYSPKSFSGDLHLLQVRYATEAETFAYRNLALNPFDQHENQGLFPHATANAETRNESVFAARNAVDGCAENHGHGGWPYQSWGINRDPNAELRIEFGREVTVDRAVLTLRADFPHDSHWVQATLAFSDGTEQTFPLTKTGAPQEVRFAPRAASRVTLKHLVKADDESPFPALSQIEVWGREKE